MTGRIIIAIRVVIRRIPIVKAVGNDLVNALSLPQIGVRPLAPGRPGRKHEDYHHPGQRPGGHQLQVQVFHFTGVFQVTIILWTGSPETIVTSAPTATGSITSIPDRRLPTNGPPAGPARPAAGGTNVNSPSFALAGCHCRTTKKPPIPRDRRLKKERRYQALAVACRERRNAPVANTSATPTPATRLAGSGTAAS